MVTLSQWEEDLSDRIGYIELLGEINLSKESAQQLGELIANYIHQHGSFKVVDSLIKRYPVTLAVYLVAVGVYKYQDGNYWSGVEQAIGLSLGGNAQNQLRAFLEKFIQDRSLPVFSEGGHKYVGSILLHGDIPDYSLPDVFRYCLSPALVQPEFAGLETRDIIALWLERLSLIAVDKPIARFLQLGGKLAIDFVARCLDMGRYLANRDTKLNAEELGLPVRIVEAYQHWAQECENTTIFSHIRLMRPNMIVDPWGCLYIELPE